MATRNRETLKKSFGKGKRPSEVDFQNLIDSTVNILDDGFSKDAQTGIKLAPLSEDQGTVMTFLQSLKGDGGSWEIAVMNHQDLRISKVVSGKVPEQLVLMKNDGDMEIGAAGRNLRINGVLSYESRRGTFGDVTVPADGKWQDVTEDLEGVYGLDVVCVCGKRNTGKHAILLAQATHCFGSKPRIRRLRSHYGSFGNKLKIRWVKTANSTARRLQVRTRFSMGSDIMIRCMLTQLWENPLME